MWSIESPKAYTQFVQELFRQSGGEDGGFVLSDGDKEISLSKKMEIIDAPLRVTPNDKRILAKLYSQLERNCVEECYIKMQEIYDSIRNFLLEIEYTSDAILDFDDSMDLTGIFKLANLRMYTEEDNLAGRIALFMQNANKYLGISIFVTMNLLSYISLDELTEILKVAEEYSFKILLIESSCPKEYAGVKYIFDKDFCEI